MDISIIIPCYNSGRYLYEALESVERSDNISGIEYEIIIVNDGSTDKLTENLLDNLHIDNCRVLHRENGGPAAARNTGVNAAKAPYLLFLDSDNRLRPKFINRGISMLSNEDADIIYGNAAFFGDATRDTFNTGPFDFTRMLWMNYIDICSIMRKTVWTDIGGFDEDRMLIGFEDWDFWIRAAAAEKHFKHVDEVLFEYRIHGTSLLAEKNTSENFHRVVDHLYQKHAHTVATVYRETYPLFKVYKRDETMPLRSFFKFFYMKYIKPHYNIDKLKYADRTK